MTLSYRRWPVPEYAADLGGGVFTQSAPPPGYTATYAFKATPSGWQALG